MNDMYVRQPNIQGNRIKVPENYNGHAFQDPPLYNTMPPPIRQIPPTSRPNRDLPPEEKDEALLPEESGTPFRNLSERPDMSEMPEQISAPPPTTEMKDLQASSSSTAAAEPTAVKQSLFSALLPPNGSVSRHFPFGHGIGSEELLILAMMLLVYLADGDDGRDDSELLLLLGLLLFAG